MDAITVPLLLDSDFFLFIIYLLNLLLLLYSQLSTLLPFLISTKSSLSFFNLHHLSSFFLLSPSSSLFFFLYLHHNSFQISQKDANIQGQNDKFRQVKVVGLQHQVSYCSTSSILLCHILSYSALSYLILLLLTSKNKILFMTLIALHII